MSLDNALLQSHGVRLYGSDKSNFDIINDIIENNGSEQPFYVVDLGEIVSAVARWRELLPMVTPYYAVKCNPNHVMLEALASLDVNFDCASEAEIKTVVEITEDPTRVVFANPIKMPSQIRYARANDVDLMTFDSEEELYKVKLFHPQAKLVLRLAVDDSKSICKFNKKFGCTLDQVKEILVIAKTLKLNVIGFSFHVGSGCSSADTYYDALETVHSASEIAKDLGFQTTLVDIGGGFKGMDEEGSATFVEITERITAGIEHFFGEADPPVQFIAEPGRYFVQTSAIVVTSIIGKKTAQENGEKIITYYLNDGVYGSFNCNVFDHARPTVQPFNERNEKRFKTRLFGPTCDSIDIIADCTSDNPCMLPDMTIGEWVYAENMGAYTSAAASTFNGFKVTTYYYVLRS